MGLGELPKKSARNLKPNDSNALTPLDLNILEQFTNLPTDADRP